MKWIIYKHTNLVNGKVYIGQTCKKPEYRWNNGRGYTRTDTHFSRAILLYGWKNFSHEIIEYDIESRDKANEREIYWIKYYDSFTNGYNDTYGGNNHDHEGKSILQLSKNDLSIIAKYKSIAEASRINKFNATNIGRCCRSKGIEAYGYFWCFKENYLSFRPKEYDRNYVPVLMLDKNNYHIIRKFKSLQEAANYLNTNHSNIMNVCKRKNTTSNGYTWCYEKDYYEGWLPKQLEHGEHGNKKIICFETKEIYKSINDAARKNGASTGNMLICLKNKQKTIKGRHFVYLDEFDESYLPPQKFENKRKVYCFENDKIYNSISECSLELEISPSQIVGVCIGKNMTAKRLHFCYLEDKNTFIQQRGKQQRILCIETNIVYDSHKQALEKTGIRHILECCKGNAISAGGYHWCYYDERYNYIIKEAKIKRKVLCVDTNEIFESITEASKYINRNLSTLKEALDKGYKCAGYMWKYL